ncbi:hypothetical protein CHUAL_003520 [Chamberlinius hualienensis]
MSSIDCLAIQAHSDDVIGNSAESVTMKTSGQVPSESVSTSHSYPSTANKSTEPFLPCNIDAPPTTALVGESSSNNSTGSYVVHPAAIVLRLRVTQVVCGIMTTVLGAVACIEECGDFRLGTGVVAGIMSVAASIASIRATFNAKNRNEDRARWIIQYVSSSSTLTTTNGDCSGQSMMLSTLWALAVVSNMVMLAFIFMSAFPSTNRNLIIIGSLELGMGATVLVILVANLFLALHYRGRQK